MRRVKPSQQKMPAKCKVCSRDLMVRKDSLAWWQGNCRWCSARANNQFKDANCKFGHPLIPRYGVRICQVCRTSVVRRRRARLAGCRINDFTVKQWNLLLSVFNNRCAYCLAVSINLHQEHIIPISKGGDHTLTNVVPSCKPCNLAKGTQTWKPLLKFGTYA